MANTRQAKKRVRQSENHRQHNMALRSMYRSAIKKVAVAIEHANKSEAVASYKEAVPVLDKMVCKGIIHKNKAARHKSRLSLNINKMA